MFYLSSNRRSVGEFAKGKGGKVAGVKNLGNGWSKSIVLENKVFLNFDVRHGAIKSGHLDLLLQSYGQIYFNIF